ncbi:MAG: bacteriohemerythrin [Methylophilaceae bacterium]|uniref:bacteriohemerythrin n=1 Tax=Methylibium sp. TaxID=2067992 RepID=UPI00359698FB
MINSLPAVRAQSPRAWCWTFDYLSDGRMSTNRPGRRPDLRDASAPQPANSASLTWSDARLLGYGPMDETHEEFYRVTFELLTCDETQVQRALDAVETHALEHFNQEDAWMRDTAFPPRECHIQEHASVLQSLNQVKELIHGGLADASLARNFAMFLFEWFPGHADYLDSALAAWMSKRMHGGQSVVVRRSLRQDEGHTTRQSRDGTI